MSLNPPKGKWKKFFAIVFCFFLMFAEIGLLRHQQATSEERFEKGEEHFGTLLFNFQQVDKDLIAYTVAQQRVEDDLKKPQPKIPNETSNLKRSALRLSADILNFLVERDAKTLPIHKILIRGSKTAKESSHITPKPMTFFLKCSARKSLMFIPNLRSMV